MLYLTHSDWCSIKHHYEHKIKVIVWVRYNHQRDLQSIHNNKSNIWQWKNTVYDIQMQDENWSASRIWSSFDYYEVMFTHHLHATHNSLIMKENECRSFKHSSKNTFFHQLFSEWQDDNK